MLKVLSLWACKQQLQSYELLRNILDSPVLRLINSLVWQRQKYPAGHIVRQIIIISSNGSHILKEQKEAILGCGCGH